MEERNTRRSNHEYEERRRGGFFDGFIFSNAENIRAHFGDLKRYLTPKERAQKPQMAIVAFSIVAGIIWGIAEVFKLVFKTGFLGGFLSVISTLAMWAFGIGLVIFVLLLAATFFFWLWEWLSNRFYR
ncbi:hypothetical protein IJM16_03220 [Candidatus Saccharibacteria bacterium]|nr:hypothetical protein [Candidatus Saccharibacteria bacterium]